MLLLDANFQKLNLISVAIDKYILAATKQVVVCLTDLFHIFLVVIEHVPIEFADLLHLPLDKFSYDLLQIGQIRNLDCGN